MAYVDFQSVKDAVSIERAAAWLGLDLKKIGEQMRGRCPIHDGGERALVITPAKGLWYCFAPECQVGGDVIELVAKVKQVTARNAAIALQEHLIATPKKPEVTAQELRPLDYLESGHALVQALGFLPEVADAIGIGYAAKGIMRGRVAVPLRTADGTLVGYAGINPDLQPPVKLPSKFFL